MRSFIILFQKMVVHGQHTFLYAQVLMHLLTKTDGKHEGGLSIIRRLCQEVQSTARERYVGNTFEQSPNFLHVLVPSGMIMITKTNFLGKVT